VADVAVLGLGRMGAAMALRLVAAGHDVTVWNRTTSVARDLVAQVASPRLRAAPTAAEAAADAFHVLSVLASGEVTVNLLLSDEVLASLRPGAVVCDLGTSGIAAAQALAQGLASAGCAFVDAPVSGSVSTVQAGQLLVMASGDEGAIDQLRPVLAAFAKRVAFLGAAGAGQAMKLSVNLVVHGLNAVVSEALVLATRAGIDPAAAYDVFSDSVVAAPYVLYKRAAFLDPSAPVAMTLDLVAKDLGLISAAADDLDVTITATRAVAAEVDASLAAGYGGQDMAALTRFLGQQTSSAADVP